MMCFTGQVTGPDATNWTELSRELPRFCDAAMAARGDRGRGGRMSPGTYPTYQIWLSIMLKMVQIWVVVFSNFFWTIFSTWDGDLDYTILVRLAKKRSVSSQTSQHCPDRDASQRHQAPTSSMPVVTANGHAPLEALPIFVVSWSF